MDIGTAKVTKEEADGIFHYLVDCMEPAESYSAAIFQEKAREYISKENKRIKFLFLSVVQVFMCRDFWKDMLFHQK